MNLSGIISISGFPGLFKIVAQSKNGVIVESLVDKKRMPAYSRFKISALEDISIFGKTDDVLLSEILKTVAEKNNYGALEAIKSDADLTKFMLSIFPEFDSERVHTSDIKKVISWYGILQKNDLLKQVEETKEAGAKEGKEKVVKAKDTAAKAAPKVKAAPKTAGKTSASKAGKTATVRKTGA